MKQRYSREFRSKMTRICRSGTPVTAVAREYGIPTNTLYSWLYDSRQVAPRQAKKHRTQDVYSMKWVG